MSSLTLLDRQWITKMRQDKILEDVDPHRLDQSRGIIMVACADGDQMPGIFQYQADSQVQRTIPRIHTLSLNGGAILLASPPSPILQWREDMVLLEHIKTARRLKEIDSIALYAHAPCGAAYLAKLDFLEVARRLMEAKTILKKTLNGATVACFCHIDYGEKATEKRRKKTYFLSRQRWTEWAKTNLEKTLWP